MPGFARYAVGQKKVGIIPGSVFYPPQEVAPNTFRLPFAKVNPEIADEGVRPLASAFREYRRN
jgi:Aspartate/tyrosine/aromatic aminotransferase